MDDKTQIIISDSIDPNYIYELTKTTSNDMSLGQQIRQYIWEIEKNLTT